MLSVIIPASNEAAFIGPCLSALCASRIMAAQVIVVANGCRDETAQIARELLGRICPEGWQAEVLELTQGSKPGALNAGETRAVHGIRVYLDADVIVSPLLLAALARVLEGEAPLYASGTARIPRPEDPVSRAYARFWQMLPFHKSVAPGYGLFAVNAAGRARWGGFPDLISDDGFVRLHFAPEERRQVAEPYDWPMIEGFARLVRVRRRQDAGMRQLLQMHPNLARNEGKARLGPLGLARLALRAPLGFLAYAAVSLAVRMGRGKDGFTRGR